MTPEEFYKRFPPPPRGPNPVPLAAIALFVSMLFLLVSVVAR